MKYQFFIKPNTDRKAYTFLRSDSETFLKEKQQLIDQGFEVDGDYIHAESDKEAIDKFLSGFIYSLEEYNAANPVTALVMSVTHLLKSSFKRNKK
ncbi:hypothetical protein C942_01536 [Photobacterium marinum]|uniref:Uncharacterized protein n=1 Tax=Photobacterium marinum TaxID=1056511 RepID=L8JFG4_9GAMM|nr:hypothetical protein [Photobacterium marinum]ELR67606.1 hypothetical protein C942_01536 [Photobacterium marinum]